MAKPSNPAQLLGALRDIERLRRQRVPTAGLDPQLALLRQWQSARLARTHADVLAHPRYRPACEFFLNDLYGARDFTQRDRDIEEMYAFMQRWVPEPLLRPLTRTVELHYQTQALDEHLLAVLTGPVGVTTAITEAQYAEAYRLCDNYADRKMQIDRIVEIGLLLEGIMRLPFIGAALALAQPPARKAGWTDLSDFLQRGYDAFKNMKNAKAFLQLIQRREMRLLDNIFAQAPDPFGWGASPDPAALDDSP